MTKKHFVVFANMLKSIPSTALRLEFAKELIPLFKSENERFKEDVFRKAANCNVNAKGEYVA
jgi:hypothetical protein